LYVCNYLPFEEDLTLYFNNLKSPLPKDDLYQVSLKLASWFWRRRFFKISKYFVKVYRQTDGQKDDGQKAIRKAHLSLQLR
jgi:hypothetical protein